MRIIFLNAWYGKTGEVLNNFLSKSSIDTDIFCLNEVDPVLFLKFQEILPNFNGIYEQSKFDEVLKFIYGQAIFTKKGIKAQKFNKIFNDPIVFTLPIKIIVNEKSFFIINVHGKAQPGHKLDTPARIKQSEVIIFFLKDKSEPKIIGGDFNLMPDTKSVKMFENTGDKNLIKEFGIKETRGEINHRNYKGSEIQHFSDYCFVSKDIKVSDFKVPNIEVSDHLPLILDFEI